MRFSFVFILACVLALVVPWLSPGEKVKNINQGFPGWPAPFATLPFRALPLNQGELRFESEFPGRMNKFSDGTREIAIRWVTEPTRMLHPASDCLQGLGYAVKSLPLFVDEEGQRWGCMEGRRRDQTMRVRERIYDNAGQSWTDVSAWYWAAVLAQTDGPWFAITIAERQ
jgi:hypothetical protein